MAKRKPTKKTVKKELLKLNLAGGQTRIPEFVNVDIAKLPEVDVVLDLTEFPWPWEENSVGEIQCSHYVEHTSNLIAFMDECCRIMAPGAKMVITAPYYSSMRAAQDPTHLRAICESTFLYFNKGWMKSNRLDHYGIKSDFDFSYQYMLSPEWAVRSTETQQFAIRNYINVVSDIVVTLVKRPHDGSIVPSGPGPEEI